MNSESPLFGSLLRLQLRVLPPTLWLGPAWAALCGLVASGRLAPAPRPLVFAALAVIAADTLLGSVWSVLTSTAWRAPATVVPLPVASMPAGSPGKRFARLIGLALARWRIDVWPRLGTELTTVIAASMLALLIAALLSPAALGLSLAVIILALAAAAFPSLGANGLVRGLFAVGLPWLIGQAALGPLGWSSVTLAALYVVSYAALLDQRFGRGDRRLWLNAAQGLGVVVLLVVGQPILAGIVVLIVLPQIALQSFLSRGEGQWYVQYAQPLVMIGMLVAAIGVIG